MRQRDQFKHEQNGNPGTVPAGARMQQGYQVKLARSMPVYAIRRTFEIEAWDGQLDAEHAATLAHQILPAGEGSTSVEP